MDYKEFIGEQGITGDPVGISRRPPLGVMPKYIWEEKRLDELREAIQRYLKGFYSIPIEWVDEYNKLIREQDERNKIIKKHNDELQKNRR